MYTRIFFRTFWHFSINLKCIFNRCIEPMYCMIPCLVVRIAWEEVTPCLVLAWKVFGTCLEFFLWTLLHIFVDNTMFANNSKPLSLQALVHKTYNTGVVRDGETKVCHNGIWKDWTYATDFAWSILMNFKQKHKKSERNFNCSWKGNHNWVVAYF
jgi:hypothetical protein